MLEQVTEMDRRSHRLANGRCNSKKGNNVSKRIRLENRRDWLHIFMAVIGGIGLGLGSVLFWQIKPSLIQLSADLNSWDTLRELSLTQAISIICVYCSVGGLAVLVWFFGCIFHKGQRYLSRRLFQ